MKKSIFLSLFLFVLLEVHAQDFTKIEKNRFENPEDYKKAEPEILKLTNFLLNTPTYPLNSDRGQASIYVLQWLSGSNFTFDIDDRVIKLTKGSGELFAMYMISKTKVLLSNPNKKLSEKKIYKMTSKILATYCANEKNNLKPSKALKKIIKKMKKN